MYFHLRNNNQISVDMERIIAGETEQVIASKFLIENLLAQVKRLRASENKLQLENEELRGYKTMIDCLETNKIWDNASKEWVDQ